MFKKDPHPKAGKSAGKKNENRTKKSGKNVNHHQWILTGFHAIEAVLSEKPWCAVQLISRYNATDQDRATQALIKKAQDLGIPIQHEKNPIASLQLICRPWEIGSEKTFWEQFDPTADRSPWYLMLDQVTDPHNFGACLRSAEAAGIDAVFVPEHGSAPFTEVVLQTSSGAAATIPCYNIKNFARFLEDLKKEGFWVMGSDVSGTKSIYETDLKGKLVLIMGSEGKGLRPLTRSHCDHLFQIPMQGRVESLNVSVATGIVLFEALRQRGL